MYRGADSSSRLRRPRFGAIALLAATVLATILVAETFTAAYADVEVEPVAIYPVQGNPLNVAVEAPGRIWYTLPDQNAVGLLIVDSSGSHTTEIFEMPQANSRPYDIAYANGTVWFTERNVDKIGAIDIATKDLSEFSIHEPVGPLASSTSVFLPTLLNKGAGGGQETFSQPTGIAVAPNGLVWFVTFGSNQLGRLDPTTESIDLYIYPRAGAELEDVAVGLSNSPWITAPGVDRVEKFDHRTQLFETIQSTGDGSAPFNVAIAGADTPWITAPGREQMGYFLYGTLSLWVFFPPLYIDAKPYSIAHSQSETAQRIWFTDRSNNLVIQYTQDGSSLTTKTLDLGNWATNPRGIGVDEQEHAWIAVDGAIVEWRPPYEKNIYLPSIHS